MKKSLIENILIAIFILISLQWIIFPGLESKSWLVNIISLISFFLLIIFALATVGINRNTGGEE